MKITLIVPTYNEKENISTLVKEVFHSARGLDLEIIIVDDNSPDGTGAIADRLSAKYPVRVIHRPRKMGLGSAVADGFASARGSILGVIDADRSHPAQAVPKLAHAIEQGMDLVIGSRFVSGGTMKGWPFLRELISFGARILARPLTPVKDMTSGLFMLKKSVVKGISLKPRGYKILLEILVKGNARPGKIREIPICFSDRKKGRSKISAREFGDYLLLLAELYAFRFTTHKKAMKKEAS